MVSDDSLAWRWPLTIYDNYMLHITNNFFLTPTLRKTLCIWLQAVLVNYMFMSCRVQQLKHFQVFTLAQSHTHSNTYILGCQTLHNAACCYFNILTMCFCPCWSGADIQQYTLSHILYVPGRNVGLLEVMFCLRHGEKRSLKPGFSPSRFW